MALNINSQFTPRANPPSADYPTGSFKDSSLPGVFDGTPLTAIDRNDLQGFTDALLAAANITHSGVADTAVNSQRLNAITTLIYDIVTTEISKIGGNVFKPSNYIDRASATITRDDFGVGNWTTVLSVNNPVMLHYLSLTTEFVSSSDSVTVEVRITRDGVALPIMPVNKTAGAANPTYRHYVGKLARRISVASSAANEFPELSQSKGIYCESNLQVEMRISVANSADCGGTIAIDYQEGVYE